MTTKEANQAEKNDAISIAKSAETIADEAVENYEPQSVVAHLQIERPDFGGDAKTWRFRYLGRAISVDISKTNIHDQIIARGYVAIGDTWKVRLNIIERKTAAGNYKADYEVEEVLEFIPSQTQIPLVFADDGIDEIDDGGDDDGPDQSNSGDQSE